MTKLQIIKSLLDFGHFQNPALTSNLISDSSRNEKIKLTDSRILHGNSGNGKTTQAILFMRDWLATEFPDGFYAGGYRSLPVFVEMASLERHIADKNGFDSDRRYSANLALEEAKNAKLLVLDDLWEVQGTPRGVQAVKRELFEIFDHRYNQNLQTIITTNLDLEELKNKDQEYKRIVDRILGLCIPTEFSGSSYRTQRSSVFSGIIQKQAEIF
jgi:DNA replication protein DnaC